VNDFVSGIKAIDETSHTDNMLAAF